MDNLQTEIIQQDEWDFTKYRHKSRNSLPNCLFNDKLLLIHNGQMCLKCYKLGYVITFGFLFNLYW